MIKIPLPHYLYVCMCFQIKSYFLELLFYTNLYQRNIFQGSNAFKYGGADKIQRKLALTKCAAAESLARRNFAKNSRICKIRFCKKFIALQSVAMRILILRQSLQFWEMSKKGQQCLLGLGGSTGTVGMSKRFSFLEIKNFPLHAST